MLFIILILVEHTYTFFGLEVKNYRKRKENQEKNTILNRVIKKKVTESKKYLFLLIFIYYSIVIKKYKY